jgi:magnesium-protoporphyrin O-methyltransferase
MSNSSYIARRQQLETYFDRTAVEAWKRLTSDAPVGSVRATVRAGRDTMRAKLLSWLPQDLRGARVLDAGCGTGALAIEAAKRGADVLAIDISPTLVDLARQRTPADLGAGRVTFAAGDMLNSGLGQFDHVVAMDSLIHYDGKDIAETLAQLSKRTRGSILFTVAPRTPLLMLMLTMGRLFPRSDRSPAIAPISQKELWRQARKHPDLGPWRMGRSFRVSRGFYISQALEISAP